ncbi:polyprenyl synthetase family protein [Hydrogenophilus thermoluteolus]|nr:polyprenyl synthetase family protein [Hydrogenophilus thermoluteolus]MBW7656472.1 polyprenyl synthetase family protein [Hydrogenophilus thermoluteolus]
MAAALPFLTPVREAFRALDEMIREQLHSDVALVRTIADYLIAAGGKRLRPAVHLLAAGACGYEGQDRVTLAAVIEFIHSATLLHDDVVDESDLRRGRRTANAVFGNAASVLVGDFLYSRSFELMVSVGRMRVMEILAKTTNAIAEGEVLQLMNCGNPEVTWDDYFRVIDYKTAKLFEASAQLGAVVADAPPAVESALATYGRHLGIAFQIADDVLDYTADEAQLGKHLGDDLAEGKPTYPLLYVLEQGNDAQKRLVREVIETGARERLDAVVAAVEACGAIAASYDAARCHAETAKKALTALPSSPCRESLLQLADFAVERTF